MIRRLAWRFLVATVVAGLVGAARQRMEVQQVRGGERPRAPTAAPAPPAEAVPSRVHKPTVAGTNSLGDALARWVPAAPTTPAGRVAAVVWASPLTLLGALVGATSGGRPRWSAEHGCVVIEGAHTGSARLLALVGAGANTLGHVVVSRYDPTQPLLLAHEAGHVRQAERLGVLLAPAYLWLSAVYGYHAHPLERSARTAAYRWRTTATTTATSAANAATMAP